MPCPKARNEDCVLEDTTLLIYDPPGQAFATDTTTVEFARFVKRSNCVLFLVDLTSLAIAIASNMEKLLNTYILAMRRMEIEKGSQHLIVVYTKSDDTKVSIPQFTSLLTANPWFEEYLSTQLPPTLKNPKDHLTVLNKNSQLLEYFTRDKLDAHMFINLSAEWFATVNFTAVSSLGAAPEKLFDKEGKPFNRLAVEISPRGVADPLLYVLAKSKKKAPPSVWRKFFTKVGIVGSPP
jgi:hypothetical protein